jgi:phosphoserine phosphatase RsbU/P
MVTGHPEPRQSMLEMTVGRAALDGLDELVRDYATVHGVEAWLWTTRDGVPELVVGTSPRAGPGANTSAVQVPGDGVNPLQVEVGGADMDFCAGRAAFLARLIASTLRARAESRFFGREIAERYEEITLLYTISEILGSVISLQDAARRILREVTDTMGVDRAALWIHEPDMGWLRLVAAVGGDPPTGPIRLDDKSSITAAVFREKRPMILEADDVYPRQSHFGAPSNRDSFLAVPVNYTPPQGKPRTIGVINLVGRRYDESFSAGDHKLITAIASQVGAAIENSRLVEQSLSQERLVREMELAHDLQLKLLPNLDQFRDRADVAARCIPADSVGGDFYHMFRLPRGCLGVMIGDVSSHGFGAALIMALTMSAVAIHAAEGDPPAEVLRRLHHTLADELETTEMYMTLFYGVIDPNEGKLSYANAGHPNAFVISRSGEVNRLGVTSPPLGIVDPDSYSEDAVPWATHDDLLFLFTDGLSDILGQGQGERRLLDQVVNSRERPLDLVIESLFKLEAVPSDVPSDDRTAVLVRL